MLLLQLLLTVVALLLFYLLDVLISPDKAMGQIRLISCQQYEPSKTFGTLVAKLVVVTNE